MVAQLLGSKQNSDILEVTELCCNFSPNLFLQAIDFFVSAFEFGLLDAMLGVRRMLSLIWSQEKTIKDAVVAAYKRLYINVESNNSRTASNAIATNLIALVVGEMFRVFNITCLHWTIAGATLGEETSLEKLVSEFVLSKDIGKGVFQVRKKNKKLKLLSKTIPSGSVRVFHWSDQLQTRGEPGRHPDPGHVRPL